MIFYYSGTYGFVNKAVGGENFIRRFAESNPENIYFFADLTTEAY